MLVGVGFGVEVGTDVGEGVIEGEALIDGEAPFDGVGFTLLGVGEVLIEGVAPFDGIGFILEVGIIVVEVICGVEITSLDGRTGVDVIVFDEVGVISTKAVEELFLAILSF